MTVFDVTQSPRRAKLGDYAANPIAQRAASSPMMRPDTIVESPLIGPSILSILVHLMALILILYRAPIIHGTPDDINQPQVEMVFDAPPSKQGLKGPQVHNPGSDAPAVSAPPVPQESTPAPVVPSPETPSSTPAPVAPSGDLAQAPEIKRPLTPATPKAVHRNPISKKPSPRQRNTHSNPFSHPMDLSFSGEPSPRKRRHGRKGGSRGPVDFSLGPLSVNGKINAPYRTRNHIKGVSSDYGSEVDRWIRAHMFYPDEAAQAGEDGPSSVHVVIDRTGHVRSVRLTNQSGSYSLDAATVGMFQGAQLPPVPPDMSGDHFDLDVTINYILIH
ncbi:energy transducer TonB [Aristophania vespae]|uniref:energy transducer TonB n=1 Tax=Aristophania vespae TaxID=2697033 RepID=UPI0023514092|nr:energy transducer TonB [Aristophania vespae]UMM64002.1 hypothetical protein DM15PD_09820 [Aristophania vespae]